MRYLTNDTNIATGTATATNVIGSSAFELIERDAEGGGTIELSGTYTGAATADFELEILTDTFSGVPSMSEPRFSGVGSGTLTGLSASSGTAAQDFTVTVLDTGTETTAASAQFQGRTLRARATGSGGNNLSLRISQAGLSFMATEWALTAQIQAGTSVYDGERYNFGAGALDAQGNVPDDAPRLRFGDDATVYRHWRTWAGGRYRYHFSPAPTRDFPVGTLVYLATGSREATVYDGATLAETHTGITSLYSLLIKLRNDSTLIDVDGVVAADRKPGGMACDDLNVFTASYSNGSEREGTTWIKRADISLTVDGESPTEQLEIECLAAPIPGSEIWGVRGSVSGALSNALTGIAYDEGGYTFTIPTALQPGAVPAGDKSAALELLARSATEQTPVLCVSNFLLGAEAQTRTYTFVWAPRPADECDCSGATVKGYPDDDLLGIDPPETTGMASIPAAILSRVTTLTTWRSDFVNANTEFVAASGDLLTQVASNSNDDDGGMYWSYVRGVANQVSAILQADRADIRLADQVYALWEGALFDIYTELTSFPSAAGTAFDTEWGLFDTFMAPLETNVGSDSWDSIIHNSFAEWAVAPGSGTAKSDIEEETAQRIARQLAESQNLTADPAPVLSRARAAIAKVYIAAGLRSPFEVAVGRGNAAWQDHGGDSWFVCQDGGLLPIQPGWYYHSARMVRDDDGVEEPESTREFGIGVAIGCESALKYGDRLVIKIGPYANARATYQAGDRITVEVIRADPVALSGGVTGDDTLTIGVIGTDHGPYADYLLDVTAPAAYSDDGLEFAITPGLIDFAAGDQWTFSAEGGTFRWRKNAGSWTTTDIADTVSLSDGVSAEFIGGDPPSFVVGDSYTFRAIASNGIANAQSPDDTACAWSGSTQINLTTSGAARVVMLAQHTIPSTATITLSASDDNFATTAYSQALTWRRGTIVYLLPADRTHAKWRLTVNESGSIGWLYLGTGRQLLLPTGAAELGTLEQAIAPRTALRARTVAGTIRHSAVTQDSVNALLDSLESALVNDDGRMGYVTRGGDGDFVRLDQERIQVTDALRFQPADTADRLLSLSITVQPA